MGPISEKVHVVCIAPVHFLPDVREELERLFHVSYGYNLPKEEVRKLLPGAMALVVNPGAPYRIDTDLLEAADRLQLIVTPSTGSDHIDSAYCRQKGIEVRSLKGRNDVIENIHASAEFSFALLLAMIRNLVPASEAARQGAWREIEDQFRGIELSGKSLGLIGYGRIGRKMSRFAHAFGARITAYDPHVPSFDPWVVRAGTFQEVLSSAEIVSVHVHLDDTTRRLFNREAFQTMKKGAYFLNTSRGEIVDDEALLGALKSGHLTAAAVDVLTNEQSPNIGAHPLIQYSRSHPHLTVTPHIAGLTVDSQRKAARFAVEELRRHFL